MEPATFRQWLAERGCRFDSGKDSAGTHGHASVTVHHGHRKSVLPGIGTKQALDPAVVRQIVDDLGLDRSELPGPVSRA
ncbi:hypothetical protein [Methylobacterium sp. NEAU K]|uniref:hypothetical protein n=1 Tax=Methylobacterium sp. NEAU K TaxID=3064946 RepID=UPI0027329C40|nr:hypothetical protein [Methylobacterium sp. NEAU K]MDP4006371.1 hypothetical protein [Methylobacterium sp. NEAU K]